MWFPRSNSVIDIPVEATLLKRSAATKKRKGSRDCSFKFFFVHEIYIFEGHYQFYVCGLDLILAYDLSSLPQVFILSLPVVLVSDLSKVVHSVWFSFSFYLSS